jgi:hypothetical protein
MLGDDIDLAITGTDISGSPDGHGVWYWRFSAAGEAEIMVLQYGNLVSFSGDLWSSSRDRDFSAYVQEFKDHIDEAGQR